MKKAAIFLLIAFAVLCSAGCSSSENKNSQSFAAERTEETAAASPSPDYSDTQSETKSITREIETAGGEHDPEFSAEINTDLISELGMTFSQLTEKYGEPHGIYNSYEFGSGVGYGRYGWKSDGKIFDDNMESAGGCNFIVGVNAKDLFLGMSDSVNFDELSNQYNLVPVSIDSEIGEDGVYWAEFSCPLYDNVSFIFSTLTYGSIDESAKCTVSLNVDCLKAEPVVIN